jgi:hypothetical protein
MFEGKAQAKAAGWGPAFMDGGSGYDLANRALSAMCKAHDGRGATTLLVDVGAHCWLAAPVWALATHSPAALPALLSCWACAAGPQLSLQHPARGAACARTEAAALCTHPITPVPMCRLGSFLLLLPVWAVCAGAGLHGL